jgi:hypothetical protein
MQRPRPALHLFENRAAKEKKRLEVLVLELSPGPKRDEILEKISQLDAAVTIDKWASSPVCNRPGNAMADRETYLKKAAECREKAKTDPAKADY